jgi:RND family efflux transporter MFP subunit
MNGLRISFVVLLSAIALPMAGCDSKVAAPVAPPVVTGLDTAQATLQQVPIAVDAVGTVHASESTVLAAQVMGRVVSVAVQEGDAVRMGQTLVTLDSAAAHSDVERTHAAVDSSKEQVQAAEADASLAASTLKRYELLHDRKSVSPQEFDEVEHRAEAATARLASSRAQLQAAQATASGAGTAESYSRLRSPFAGFVTARHVDPGAMATPGLPLLEVEKTGTLQLNATVDESLMRTLQKGMTVPVEIAGLSTQTLSGRIAEFVPAADAASHSFLVKIDLPAAAGLRSGMFGTASIGNGSHAALLIPRAALVTHGSLQGVWVLDDARIASLRYVTLGAKRGDNVEVLSGLSANETVVLSPGDRELGGDKIEARP